MANEAEVDLVVSTAGALPQLERQLTNLVRRAEDTAEDIDLQATLDVRESVRRLGAQLETVVDRAQDNGDDIEVDVIIDQRAALGQLERSLDQLVREVERGQASDPIAVQAVIDAPRSLRVMRGELDRIVTAVQATAPDVEIDVEFDRNVDEEFGRLVRNTDKFAKSAEGANRSVLALGRGVAQLSLAVGGGANAALGLVTALEQIGPAAAVGTQALLAQKLAVGTLQLAMVGIEDAIKDAFDPDVSVEDFHKSLERLAPEARLFVDEIHTVRRELRAIQQGVQNRVFQDLDTTFRQLARQSGPAVTKALNSTAVALNLMAKEAAGAAGNLAEQGVLGKALDGATKGLNNLVKVPAQLAGSFTLLAAAAAPAFDRITRGIAKSISAFSEGLARAFATGELEKRIDAAIATIAQLGRILGNFAKGIGNIFGGLTQNGEGLFTVLEKVSQAFVRLTASKEFQVILTELSQTAGVLIDAILPILEEAFVQLSPVIAALAPVVRDFIKAIGPELIPLVQELGPVLIDIAIILREQLPFAIQLTSAVLKTLTVVLRGVHAVMQNVIIPVVRAVANVLQSEFAQKVQAVVRVILSSSDLLVGAFQRWTARAITLVADVNRAIANFGRNVREALIGGLTSVFADAIGNIRNFAQLVVQSFGELPGRMYRIGLDIMAGLASGLTAGISRVLGIARGIANSISATIKGALDSHSPSRVTAAIGRDVVRGLEVGMKNQFSTLVRTARGVGEGLARGIQVTPGISSTLSQSVIPRPLEAGPQVVNVYIGNRLIEDTVTDRFRSLMNQRDRAYAQGVRL